MHYLFTQQRMACLEQLVTFISAAPYYSKITSPYVSISYPSFPDDAPVKVAVPSVYKAFYATNFTFYITDYENCVHEIKIERCECLGDFVNAANDALQKCLPSVVFSLEVNDLDKNIPFVLVNHIYMDSPYVTDEQIGAINIFNSHSVCLGGVEKGRCIRLDLSLFYQKLSGEVPSYFLVPRDIRICSVYVTLYRKKDAGFYEMYEDIWLPAGLYLNLECLAAGITNNIKMKGERNGAVFKFEKSAKRPVLRIMAHHRQPPNSTLRLIVADGSKAVGLTHGQEMPLGNRRFIDFSFMPNTMIV